MNPLPDSPPSQVWTFHGLARILTSMKLFPQDAEIQLECCVLLASIGELLHNNGYATEVFKILELAMRKHEHRASCSAKVFARVFNEMHGQSLVRLESFETFCRLTSCPRGF